MELYRLLKIICINEKEDLKKFGKNFKWMFHPLPLSILCQEFQLANYISIKLYPFLEIEERGSYMLEWLKILKWIKHFIILLKCIRTSESKPMPS